MNSMETDQVRSTTPSAYHFCKVLYVPFKFCDTIAAGSLIGIFLICSNTSNTLALDLKSEKLAYSKPSSQIKD